jgi:hypothetical protein
MSLTDNDKKWLKDLARTSVDDARSTIECRERNGRLMTIEECEYCLSLITPASKTLWKLFESKARKAFREWAKDDSVSDSGARMAASGCENMIGHVNYSTLRKALYLATDKTICERIRREIQTRFPWGNWK